MLLQLLLVLLGLAGLFYGGNALVDGSSRLARSFGVPAMVVGLTVVAFGTSAPELLVSLQAALQGSSGIAIGNVVGSNVANIGLILGITGLVAPIRVNEVLVRREIPWLIVITAVAYGFIYFDAEIGRTDGIIMLAMFVTFNLTMLFLTIRKRKQPLDDDGTGGGGKTGDPNANKVNRGLEFGRLVVGIVLLVIGANLTVTGASAIASELGISDVIIGITLVAFGTSLPELAASMVAAFRDEADIAVGNVIGSNIANLLLILGATGVVLPIPVDQSVISFDYPAMFLFTLLMVPFALDRVLRRGESGLYLIGYAGFIAAAFIR